MLSDAMKAELDMQCPQEFGTMPECDCPFEHWHINGVCLDIHFEDDGSCHVLIDSGEADDEMTLEGMASLDEARPLAFAWAERFFQPQATHD